MLNLILGSHKESDPKLSIHDSVQIFSPGLMIIRGRLSLPKSLLYIDKKARTVTVPGRNNRTIVASFEDVRVAIEKDSLACLIAQSIEEL